MKEKFIFSRKNCIREIKMNQTKQDLELEQVPEEALVKEAEEILEEESVEEEVSKDTSKDTKEIEQEEKTNKEEEKIEEASKEEQKETLKEEKEKGKKNWLHKYAIAIVIITAVLIITVILFSTMFAVITNNSDKIIAGISIKGEDVSGLTQEEAITKLTNKVSSKLAQELKLTHGEYEISILPEQIEANFGITKAVELAYKIGREGNILTDNYTVINTKLNKKDITPAFVYNEKALDDFIASITNNLPDKVVQSSYAIENNKLIISKGTAGTVVIEQTLKDTIVNNIMNLKEDAVIPMQVETKQPDAIDIEKIRNEIYKEPKDAYFTKNPFTIYPHVNGVDLSISVEEAKTQIANTQEGDISIPLKITTPKVTTNQIGTEAFPNLLGSFSTHFSTANGNRSSNIRLATKKINGVVLMPGETFSYNKVVGKRTAAAGFKSAHAFSGGKVVDEIGGGICQVSSTLYNTVLLANLGIVERRNHMFDTGYVKVGKDATVAWGGVDFKFKNTRNYPIKIIGTVSGGTVKIDIYGLKEATEYDVIIDSQVLQRTPRKVVYQNDATLEKGTQKVIQSGYDGVKSKTYKTLKLNGQVVSKTLLSTDTYKSQDKIIAVGTKE